MMGPMVHRVFFKVAIAERNGFISYYQIRLSDKDNKVQLCGLINTVYCAPSLLSTIA